MGIKDHLWKTKVAKMGDAHFTDANEGDIIVPCVSFLSNFNQSRDRFHSVMGPTGVGKSSVGSHGWIFLLTRHLVIHLYSSLTPTWARKRQKWVMILNRALRPSSLSSLIFPKTSLGFPGALSLLTHQGSMTPINLSCHC